jgi:hypothetical protein
MRFVHGDMTDMPAGNTRRMFGNGVFGILSESVNKWERRAPLTPSHCARLLHHHGVSQIIVQPSTNRIHHDVLYEEVGCQISQDLSPCGLILGIKQPKVQQFFPPFFFVGKSWYMSALQLQRLIVQCNSRGQIIIFIYISIIVFLVFMKCRLSSTSLTL